MFYLPAFQYPPNAMTLHLRYDGDAATVIARLRKKVSSIDPRIAPISITRMSSSIAEHALFVPRMLTVLSGAFALIALTLALVGLYGVMAFMVTRRTQEIGIRMAVGAQPANVLWMVMRNGLTIVLAGLMIGGTGALLLAPAFHKLLVGVDPRDPEILAAIGCLMLIAGSTAILLPATRATHIDPLLALRHD